MQVVHAALSRRNFLLEQSFHTLGVARHPAEGRFVRTRNLILGLCIAACIGSIAVWHVEHASAESKPTAAPARVPVVAEKVRVSDVPTVLTGIGSVVAFNVVQVHAQVTGTIDKIGFTEGQAVHPGSLIAQLDPRPFQASLQ
jgi:membrane fusion protein, multidrug efflux system